MDRWIFLLCVVLTALTGCIPPSSEYPYDPEDDCIPETNDEFCDRIGAQCGQVSAQDNCGDLRTVENCGTCQDGPCTANACSCVPVTGDEFCAAQGATCGEVEARDNCDILRTHQCGSCSFGAECTDGSCVCPLGEEFETTCDDDLDNDCDGKTDCGDPDCEERRCDVGSVCREGDCVLGPL